MRKRQKQVIFDEKVNRACQNGKNNDDQKIYASMAHISSNDEFTSGTFGDISQLTNWILDSGATCHMTPEVSDFIPSFGNSAINLLLCISIFACKRFLIAFFA